MKHILPITTLILFLLTMSACAVQPSTPVEAAPISVTQTGDQTPTDETLAEDMNTEDAVLIWEGDPLADDGQDACLHLMITTDHQAFVGPCGEAGTPVDFTGDQPGGWNEMVAKFAPFAQENADHRIIFKGQGENASPAWERAIDAWAQTTVLELSSGQVSATGRTIMSWWLGQVADQPGQCRQLIVLSHGYAYGNITPCEGGPVQETQGGWIDTDDWEQLEAWYTEQTAVYQDNNYLAGMGSTEMSEAQLAELAQWAETVYSRIAPDSVSQAAPDDCPQPADGLKLLVNAADGYCLLYPGAYQVVQLNAGSVEIVLDTLMNHIDPRGSVTVEDAAGRTVEEAAGEILASYSLPDWNIHQTTMTLGGEEAFVLDNMPGQDINRRIVVVHEDRLYSFYFTPVDASNEEIYQRMAYLYTAIVDSFTFIPVVPDAPLQAGPECPEVGKDAKLFRNDAQGYCLLYHAGYRVEQPTDNETVIFAESLQDTSHPKIFIEVTPTDQTDPNAIVDAQVAEIKAALPDYEVQFSYALLVDGHLAAQIDNAPGQDISRQLFIIRDGKLYKLTFVPADPTDAGLYAEMEQLYTMIIASFKFMQE
ncbi:MAG: hypothetical protein KDJ65_32805 [Anaerolineae bacterium]|nr:hypothetical protein [Anaerolineae bacterium]